VNALSFSAEFTGHIQPSLFVFPCPSKSVTWYGELIACRKFPDNTQHYSEQRCLFEIVLAALVVKPDVMELSISSVAVLEPGAESKALVGIPQQQFEPWL
jgi:hypothetical protein